jgi:acetylornithine/N-succinyldiaminopimelate aminotransferase
MENVFFSNSGAEANEAAIKLARLFGHQKGIERPQIVVMEGAFHGRTLATLTATGNPKIQAGFAPLVEGFLRCPYDDVEALRQLLEQHPDAIAVLVEPVQGEAGVRIPSPYYLEHVRKLCDEFDCLLILDEIQGGMGRTGEWFSYQHHSLQPDIMTLAKALANGVPIGACLAGKKASHLFQPGSHGSTFGGNPLATRAALEVIHVIEEEHLLENARIQGEYLLTQLKQKLANHPHVLDIRGQGLWIGIELDEPRPTLLADAAKKGFILNVTQNTVIRLAPPLIVTREQIDALVECVVELLTENNK